MGEVEGRDAATGQGRTHAFPWGRELPLVGRRNDIQALRLALDSVLEGRGRTQFIVGEGGIGKTRLVEVLADEARSRDFVVAIGRASPMDSSLPYGVIGEALVPALRTLDEAAITVLSRGAESDVRAILPGLHGSRGSSAVTPARDPDLKGRVFWNFAQFLSRFAARTPLLLVLDNAQWADPSSLELVHFLARQVGESRIFIVVVSASDAHGDASALRAIERSLLSLGVAEHKQLERLSRRDLEDLLHAAFGGEPAELTSVAATLHARTLGNAFFVQEMLKALVTGGHVHRDSDGRWTGWSFRDVALPDTVRDAVRARLREVSEPGRRVAAVVAVAGRRTPLPMLERLAALTPDAFAEAIEELCARLVLVEVVDGITPHYEFAHPIVAETVLDGVSAVRARAMHGAIADELERHYGQSALDHATEIAAHLVAAPGRLADPRSLRFLAAAGRVALARRADREASRWLTEALAVAEALGAQGTEVAAGELRQLLEDLALAHQRTGDSDAAIRAWQRSLDIATTAADDEACSRIARRLGLAKVWAGQPTEGLALFDESERCARRAGRTDLAVRGRIGKAITLQSVGRVAEGRGVLEGALGEARHYGDPALLGRVHRSLSQLYLSSAMASEARMHAEQTLEQARLSGDPGLIWSGHWVMAILHGLTGKAEGVERHRREAERISHQIKSPTLAVWSGEIAVEYASAIGQWTQGLAMAERIIPVARAIAPRTLLPRLLVWTGIIQLNRDDADRGKQLIDEAWRLSRADELRDGGDGRVNDVHNVILAHTGRVAWHLTRGEYAVAKEYGEAGLGIADRYGLTVWAIHRLLPGIAEASLFLQDFERAIEISDRLKRESAALEHPLGKAWASTIDALVLRLRDHSPAAASSLLQAADELDLVPFAFHAARVRRNAAQLLAADGAVEEAVLQLRRAHDVFVQLGAEFELRGTRAELRSLGVRLPARSKTTGAGSLTAREVEIARFVARRLSNKEIGQRLEISARTVSTHLSNIFQKLSVDSRGALADLVRSDPALAGDDA